MRYVGCGVLLLTLCGLAPQLRCQLEQVEQLVGRAEERLEQQRKEEAAMLLSEVWRELQRVKGASRTQKAKLERRVNALLRKADPKSVSRVRMIEKTADNLVRLANDYRKRGWLAMAEDLLEQVEALDPGRVREDLLEVRDSLSPDPNQLLFDELGGGKQLFGDKPWTKGEAWLASPAMDPSKTELSQALVGSADVIGDADLRVEFKMTEQPGKAGFVFGARDNGEEFYLVEVVHRELDTAVYVRHYHGGEYHLKYTHAGSLAPDVRAGYVPLSVQIRGPDVLVTLADMPPFRARVDGPISGNVGLFVSGDTRNPEPVLFRHLEVNEF